jgi:hypothetical protein
LRSTTAVLRRAPSARLLSALSQSEHVQFACQIDLLICSLPGAAGTPRSSVALGTAASYYARTVHRAAALATSAPTALPLICSCFSGVCRECSMVPLRMLSCLQCFKTLCNECWKQQAGMVSCLPCLAALQLHSEPVVVRRCCCRCGAMAASRCDARTAYRARSHARAAEQRFANCASRALRRCAQSARRYRRRQLLQLHLQTAPRSPLRRLLARAHLPAAQRACSSQRR